VVDKPLKSVTHATPDLQLPDVPDGRLVSEGASVCGGGANILHLSSQPVRRSVGGVDVG